MTAGALVGALAEPGGDERVLGAAHLGLRPGTRVPGARCRTNRPNKLIGLISLKDVIWAP